jgi:hypothetical protein
MTNPTSNFSWQMPTPTDLVTDLPADFEVFGQAVDTDLADLLGGTTGQVLSKTSATDLDFTWTTISASGFTLISTQTMSAAASLNVNNCFTADYKNYKILVNNTTASVGDYMNLKLRVSGTDSSTNYYGWYQRNFSSLGTQPTQISNINNGTKMEITGWSQNCNAVIDILNPFVVGSTGITSVSNMWDTVNSRNIAVTSQIQHSPATSYDGFSLIPDSGTLTGIVYIYGYGA